MTYDTGDIIQADADYLWRGDRIVWRKGEKGKITLNFSLSFKIIPEGKRRSIEVEKSHPHHLISKSEFA